ncbi:hypothetical protein PV726_45575 [Streptomyces europaeiscabiei]|nr:hypothetical protein [Streptomyces europaeiscabiei]MDX3697358.1 hypothetical protein [Streptomyces europaeiscabiei]
MAELRAFISGAVLVLDRERGQGVADGRDDSVTGVGGVRGSGRGDQQG